MPGKFYNTNEKRSLLVERCISGQKSFSIVLVQGKHDSIIFQSNYIGTKNLKYWTRTVAGDSRRLVQLKHFSTVNMISGEFFKVPIPMLFPTGLSFVDSQLKGSGGLVSMEPSIACDSYDCYIINNSLSTTVCFSMLNFQLLTIKGSSFLKKEMVAEVLSSFFCVCLLFTARYDTIVLLSTTHTQSSLCSGCTGLN